MMAITGKNYNQICEVRVSIVQNISYRINLKIGHFYAQLKNIFLPSIIAYIPLIVYHSHLIVNFIPNHVDGHSRLTYVANLFNKKSNDFNKLLIILKCSVELDFEFIVTAVWRAIFM